MHLGDHSTYDLSLAHGQTSIALSNQLCKHSPECFQLTFTANYLVESWPLLMAHLTSQ
ncbi:hypothetical protein CMUS01_13737 [Colletotrichum musicola]|uniref:Uncharacterized protein n=1 Tax=Colletotrichum musicola TaxID=2175873 RepID=A0A8H6MUV0_9PEZI|nr:hypothetical protein CMUS01_13737 [Colletotrichum musicola]